nr:tRNA (adenosine(37)-N6)-threonylcarbamoyltransferase complex ATPase subunit type 1 TsaE [Gloeocapsa sp. PCC 73106]
MIEFILADPDATHRLGKYLGQLLPVHSLVLLEGELGSGKTTLVQGIGAGLGITEPILSPTFSIVNEYFEGTIPLYHLDVYRLSPVEISSLYLETYWEGLEVSPGITVIEWASLLPNLPDRYLSIAFSFHPKGGRLVTLNQVGSTQLIDFTVLSCWFHQGEYPQ